METLFYPKISENWSGKTLKTIILTVKNKKHSLTVYCEFITDYVYVNNSWQGLCAPFVKDAHNKILMPIDLKHTSIQFETDKGLFYFTSKECMPLHSNLNNDKWKIRFFYNKSVKHVQVYW